MHLFSVGRAVHRSGTWHDCHKAQFRGKSDVDNNVDKPDYNWVLRFFSGFLLMIGVIKKAIHFKQNETLQGVNTDTYCEVQSLKRRCAASITAGSEWTSDDVGFPTNVPP